MKNQYLFIGIGVAVIVILIGLGFVFSKPSTTASVNHALDSFAQCLKEKGVIFYGAFWCPHCQRTKAMFAGAAEYLPYVECSTPDGQGQTAVCQHAGVNQYPTWVFPDGSRLLGEQGLEALAQKSSCTLPPGFENSTPSNPVFPGQTSSGTGSTTENIGAGSSATSGAQQ